jgi:hypothetical protein
MRIWTFHPEYLDRQGIVALWREALLAQKVLRGLTSGYTAHPQLTRFKSHPDPIGAIGFYLSAVHEESVVRGYQFDRSKIISDSPVDRINETSGQLRHEWTHFMSKLAVRDRHKFKAISEIETPRPHPLFEIVEGGVREWEKLGETDT